MRIRILTLLGLWILLGANSPMQSHAGQRVQRDKPADSCQILTDRCAICSDGFKRKVVNNPNAITFGDRLHISDYNCATTGLVKRAHSGKVTALSLLETCEAVSDYCAICPDGKFLFIRDKIEILSDLYRCATRPKQ